MQTGWNPNFSRPVLARIPVKVPTEEQVNRFYMLFYSMVGGFASIVQTQITDTYNLIKENKKIFRFEAKKRIAEVQGKKVKNENADELTQEELIKATSKEEILRNLVIAQRKQKFGSPEWQKTTAMIADYSKIKQDEIDTENNVVHYYIPLSMPRCCEDCIIFKNGQATFQKKKE